MRKILFLIGFVSLLILVGCNSGGNRYCKVKDGIKISSIETDEETQRYKGFEICFQNKKKLFEKWQSTTTGFEPEIQLFQNNECIFICLTLDTGTEVLQQEAHILDAKTLEEIPIENAGSYVLNHVDKIYTAEHLKSDGVLYIKRDGEKIGEYKIPEDVITSAMSGKVDWGRIVSYTIEKDKLNVKAAGFASPSLYIGNLILKYEYKDNRYVVSEVLFEPDSDKTE